MKKILTVLALILTLSACGENLDTLQSRVVNVSAEYFCIQELDPSLRPNDDGILALYARYGFEDESAIQEAVTTLTEESGLDQSQLSELIVDAMLQFCPEGGV